MVSDADIRLHIYDDIVRTGEVPLAAQLAAGCRISEADVRAALRRMHDAHILVLQPGGEILMANPFSAVPTPFATEIDHRRWFGNCIWDALGILGTLDSDGQVITSCACCGDAITVGVQNGDVDDIGVVHFAVPARRWWDDIVFN